MTSVPSLLLRIWKVLGTQYEHPEIKKLEMGYVPSVESRLKLYDGIEIDLNNTWGWDWEWMQHCVEIAEDFQSGQGTQELLHFQTRV
jgi:hypothetical protein